jgi:hypothetical protein
VFACALARLDLAHAIIILIADTFAHAPAAAIAAAGIIL